MSKPPASNNHKLDGRFYYNRRRNGRNAHVDLEQLDIGNNQSRNRISFNETTSSSSSFTSNNNTNSRDWHSRQNKKNHHGHRVRSKRTTRPTSESNNAVAEDGSSATPVYYGYYFDPDSNKHFKIAPEYSGLDNNTNKALIAQKKEKERQALLKVKNTKISTISRGISILNAINGMSTGKRSYHDVNNVLDRLSSSRIAKVSKQADFTVENSLKDSCGLLNGCHFLNVSPDGNCLFGAWSGQLVGRSSTDVLFMSYKANVDENVISEFHSNPDAENGKNRNSMGICFDASPGFWNVETSSSLVDVAIAPVDSDVTCALYVTARYLMTQNGIRSYCEVSLRPIPEMSSPESTETLDSPIYTNSWTTEDSIYSCAWNGNKMLVALGLDQMAKVRDVVTEKQYTISSRKRNVLSQEFSQCGNLLFMGLRADDVICSDLRMNSRHISGSFKPSKNTGFLRVLKQGQAGCLLTESFGGQLKMWDIRNFNEPVAVFHGHRNTHHRLPCFVDHKERYLFVVGDDEHTRGWSLSSGELLCDIPSSRPVAERSDFPHVVFSDNWAGRSGSSAIVMAVGSDFLVHEL